MFGTDILRNKTMKILYFLNPLYTPAYPCFFFFEVFNCEFFISGTYFLFKLKDLSRAFMDRQWRKRAGYRLAN